MSEIGIAPGINISASGLDAEARRMEVIANNVANAKTTRDADGNVFQRKDVIFEEVLSGGIGERTPGGVRLAGEVADTTPGTRIYRPTHPDAGPDGFVEMPNVNPVAEMIDMMSSSRAFEANLTSMKTAREMATKALEIMKAS